MSYSDSYNKENPNNKNFVDFGVKSFSDGNAKNMNGFDFQNMNLNLKKSNDFVIDISLFKNINKIHVKKYFYFFFHLHLLLKIYLFIYL